MSDSTSPSIQVLQPPGWATPRGYVNGVLAPGSAVFVAGQIGWNAQGQFESDDLVVQTRQALLNVCAVLAQAGAGPAHITRMTWYVTDRADYKARARDIGAVYREVVGHYQVAMTAVQVVALMEERAKVEIEVTAVLPPKS